MVLLVVSVSRGKTTFDIEIICLSMHEISKAYTHVHVQGDVCVGACGCAETDVFVCMVCSAQKISLQCLQIDVEQLVSPILGEGKHVLCIYAQPHFCGGLPVPSMFK